MNFSFDKESLDILAQLDEKLVKDGDSTIRSDPHVYKKKDTVVYIKNLQEQAKFLSLLKINSSLALTIGIEKSIVTALILNNLKGVGTHDSVSFASSTDIPISLTGLGNIINFTGAPIIPSLTEQENKIELQSSSETVGLISGLQGAPYKRNLVSRQLYTGHMRIQ